MDIRWNSEGIEGFTVGPALKSRRIGYQLVPLELSFGISWSLPIVYRAEVMGSSLSAPTSQGSAVNLQFRDQSPITRGMPH